MLHEPYSVQVNGKGEQIITYPSFACQYMRLKVAIWRMADNEQAAAELFA